MKNRLSRSYLSCSRYGFLLAILGLCLPAPQVHAQETDDSRLSEAQQSVFEIGIGEARLLPIVGLPKTIIVGDDGTIAANIIQDDILVFTGIAHGRTNVIVLDAAGQIIEQVWISVTKSGAPLTVRRGMATEEFRCDPACRPEDKSPVAPTASESTAVPG